MYILYNSIIISTFGTYITRIFSGTLTMFFQINSRNTTRDINTHLAEELNEEMKSTVMPVTVFVGLETVFGFFGNLMILYVFLFHYKKCNFRYFVLCLCFVDTTSTLTTMPGEIVTQTFWFVYPVPIVCKSNHSLMYLLCVVRRLVY